MLIAKAPAHTLKTKCVSVSIAGSGEELSAGPLHAAGDIITPIEVRPDYHFVTNYGVNMSTG